MAAGRWDAAVSASAAVVGGLFGGRGRPAPANPYRPARPGPAPDGSVLRDVKARMFEEGLRQIARKSAARRAGGQPQ
jgi:hypothetical protein